MSTRSLHESSAERERGNRERNIEHKKHIIENKDEVIDLIIEVSRVE